MVKYKDTRQAIYDSFCGSSDVMFLDFEVDGTACALIYIDGLSDKESFDRNIIEPLKRASKITSPVLEFLSNTIYIADPIIVKGELEKSIAAIADGDIAIVIDGAEEVFMVSLKSYKMRSITEPPVSTVLRGPREGFVEDMKTNMTMVRRRLRSPSLTFRNMKVGKYTETNVAVCWLEGVADNSVVDSILNKIKAIEIDGIIDSSYIARFLENNKYSIFSEVGLTEKPDIIASKILEGRVAVIVDGSPTVLTLPFIIFEHFQASEDYYIKDYRATLTRIIRTVAIIIALLLPAAYVALQEFQYQMLPIKMLTAIMNSIYGIPLTPVLEMLLLLLLFEILTETSVRMPRYLGTALSIVGAIVLGEAAVNAGLLSTPALLVTAVSTIGMYAVPDEVEASSVLRLLFVTVAGVLGLFGLLLGVVALITYLAHINSYNSSYLAPYAPLYINDLQDSVVINNLTDRTKRPYSIPTNNRTRLKKNDK